jgi:hypothetical protein
MIKVSITLLALLTSTLALAWDDSRKDTNSYSNTRNEPKSFTLSGSSRESSDRYNSNSDRYTPRESDRASQGTSASATSYRSSGAYRRGNQINNNGLIINRD